MIKRETTLDSKFSACATCACWSGNCTTFQWPGLVIINNDLDTKGTCNNTYLGHKTEALATCTNWKQRY